MKCDDDLGWRHFDREFKNMADGLRKQVACFIACHVNEYQNAILAEMPPANFEMKAGGESNQAEEVIRNYVQELEKDGTWAGTETILAITKMFQCNIRIHNPLYNAILFTGGTGREDRTIELYYNGCNHYDSMLIERQDGDGIEQIVGYFENGGKYRMEEDGGIDEEQKEGLNTSKETTTNICQSTVSEAITNRAVVDKDIEKTITTPKATILEPEVTIIEKPFGCYWVTAAQCRIKVRSMMNGRHSYLWAASHQLSKIMPDSEAFEELPIALWEDIKKYLGLPSNNEVVSPDNAVWTAIAEMYNVEVLLYTIGGSAKSVKPSQFTNKMDSIKLFETSIFGELQIDSIEIICKKQKSKKKVRIANSEYSRIIINCLYVHN